MRVNFCPSPWGPLQMYIAFGSTRTETLLVNKSLQYVLQLFTLAAYQYCI